MPYVPDRSNRKEEEEEEEEEGASDRILENIHNEELRNLCDSPLLLG
jgi:hypothetical protein